MTLRRLSPRTRRVMRGWNDISTPMFPELQGCPECGAVAFNWWAASCHQTWHLQLAALLESALDGKAESAGELLSRHRSAVMGEGESGAVDTMLGERHSPPERED